MQRVAIARALVNDPDILLADEPTGALDSDTSVQVMDLLQEVAKDRLVVMVTHNPELAEQYATRIVTLKDGVIRSDTDPFEVDETVMGVAEHRNMGKSSMSFLTALALSFNNLKTKKRTNAFDFICRLNRNYRNCINSVSIYRCESIYSERRGRDAFRISAADTKYRL